MSALFHIVAPSRFEPEPIKGSRFVADVRPVDDAARVKALLVDVRAEFSNASHHCWGWRLADDRQQSSDDGEPGGSAGRPILAQVVGHQVVDALVVVSRWFGGTKLGVGGLVRAYGGAAGQALDRAALETFVQKIALCVQHGYEDGPAVDAVLKTHGAELAGADYGAQVERRFLVAVSLRGAFTQAMRDATSGRVAVVECDRD